jgi:hypothetical protein
MFAISPITDINFGMEDTKNYALWHIPSAKTNNGE